MFLGHFAVGFAAKRIAPRTSLGTLFMAAQFLDLLWPVLLLAGVESVRIVPGATAVMPLVFEHYPISHGLVAVLGWAILVGGLYSLVSQDRKAALVLGALVLSHWFLDAVVHRPDLPVFPGEELRAGLEAWSSLPLTVLIELSLFVIGLRLYVLTTLRTDVFGKWGLVGLVVCLLTIYAGNLFGPPPPSPEAIAWVGQSQWLLILWGYWIDKHRRARSPHVYGVRYS